MNQIDLQGRKAVVTGGCRGIGLAVVERFLASGATVAIWDFDEEETRKVRARLPGVLGFKVDVTSETGVCGVTAATVEALGGIDILVNVAGIAGNRVPVTECSYEEWKRVIDVNLNGTFLCCREVVPHMQRAGYGRVINVSSTAGKDGNAMAAHYSAAKAAVLTLTKSLAKETLEGDIRVNCIAPAAIQTSLFDALPPDRQRAAIGRIPLGRLGKVEEVAAMIAWMSSSECSFTTGFAFDLSGGRSTY